MAKVVRKCHGHGYTVAKRLPACTPWFYVYGLALVTGIPQKRKAIKI